MRLNKINTIDDGTKRVLFAFWANNRGRGRDNCTLVVVPEGTERPINSKNLIESELYKYVQVSSWRGNVNLSEKTCNYLEIKKTDINRISNEKHTKQVQDYYKKYGVQPITFF